MAFLKKLLEIDAHLDRLLKINGELRRGGRFSRLETDLVKEHLRQLYDLYDELHAMDTPEGEPAHPSGLPVEVLPLTPPVPVREVMPPADPAVASVEEATPHPAPSGVSEKLLKTPAGVREVNTRTAAARSLRELIPLNDKFVFIREFFGGSIARYEEVLAALESGGSREAALAYMDQNLWPGVDLEKQAETVERFLEIIDSKFIH